MSKWYTEEHEWLLVEGDTVTVGITDYAQEALGEIVYVELPEVGYECLKGEGTGVVESVKSASDIYAPVDGEVIEVNKALEDAPEMVNDSPEKDGWFYKAKIQGELETTGLISETDYQTLLETL